MHILEVSDSHIFTHIDCPPQSPDINPGSGCAGNGFGHLSHFPIMTDFGEKLMLHWLETKSCDTTEAYTVTVPQ